MSHVSLPVSEELFADLYLRVERLEADLKRLTPPAWPNLGSELDAMPADPPDTKPLSQLPTPTIPWPRPRKLSVPSPTLVQAAALGGILNAVVHDLCNLLAVVQGHAELLDEQLPAESPCAESVRAVQTAAHLGGQITRHLLTLAAPIPPLTTPTRTNLAELLSEIEPIVRSVVGAGVRVGVGVAAAVPGVQAPSADLVRIVLSLAQNAREAMSTGGVLAVRATAETIPAGRAGWPRTVAPGLFAVLSVTDTGHGMSLTTLEQLATPGFTTRPSGQGLGLAAIREILHRLGGHVEFQSGLDWGTTARVYLPAAEKSHLSDAGC